MPSGPPGHRLKVKVLYTYGIDTLAYLFGQQPLGILSVVGIASVVPLPLPDHLARSTRMFVATRYGAARRVVPCLISPERNGCVITYTLSLLAVGFADHRRIGDAAVYSHNHAGVSRLGVGQFVCQSMRK